MKDINYIRRDLFGPLGHARQGWGLGGTVWVKTFLGEIRPELVCELHLCTYMNGTCTGAIFGVPAPWGLEEGPKGKISLNLHYKVIFKDFKAKLFASSHK